MTIRNGDMPAIPCKVSINRDEGRLQEYQFGNNDFVAMGLTKREQFAMAAMQGLLADPNNSDTGMDRIAKYAIEAADALLAKLDKAGGE